MPNIGLEDLVTQLPRGDAFRPRKLPTGMFFGSDPNPCFVGPTLVSEIDLKPNTTSVVLLSAPGAVGKSTVAAEIARLTGSSLWDLSKIQVGSRTFSGTILEAYDFEATGVLKRIREGNFLFVLDALDEAQVRAGSQNFDAFLADLISMLREPRRKPVVVLLARSDTADWVQMTLEDAKVPLARFQIAYFEEDQATTFIDKRLDERRRIDGTQPIHRQQRQPYIQARSALFGLIYDLYGVPRDRAWIDPRVHNFLGYAPVLEALTDYLHVSNFMPLIDDLRNEATTARDPWHFLSDIIGRLLQRESEKVQQALRSSLGNYARDLGWSSWENLYTPHEQSRRVLEHSLRMLPIQTESRLPARLVEQYKEALKLILPQHPFLAGRGFANVVFKEYVYAWGVTKGYEQLTQVLRRAMSDRQEPFLPSQLFSRFIIRPVEGSVPILDGQDVGVFYESLLARAEIAESVGLTITQSGDSIQLVASLGREEETDIECDLLDSGEGIHIWRRLGRADIEINAAVKLGLPEQRFLLGPGITLSCSQLSVNCDDLDIDVSEPVQLKATVYVPGSQNLRLRIRNGLPSGLTVIWPNVCHPWASYRGSEAIGALRLQESVRGDAFRKFILMFRRQRTRKASTLMNARWAPDQLSARNELMDLAERMGVLRSRGKSEFIEFNSEYDSLRTLLEGTPQLSEKVQEFIIAYFGEEQSQRLLRH